MRVIITGGGTGGHINPALTIAKEIIKRHQNAEIIFIGTEKGLETKLVPKEGFELKLIKVKGFKRKLSLDTILSIKELIQGMFQSRKIIKEFKPDIVIGTGGYVCGPVVLNASLMKIPTVIHEQNAYPGITNRILSRFVDEVLISFDESRKYFKTNNIHLTGNPVRSEIINADKQECRQKLGIQKNEKLIVCFGGSIGAEKINEIMIKFIKSGLPEQTKLIFATGERQFDHVMNNLKDTQLKNIDVLPYIHNMHEIMPAADLLICRAGAITLSEITCIGVPAVLIPSPNVTNNHQEYNAKALQKAGAAEMILEKDLENINFKEFIENIIKDEDKLKDMTRKSMQLGKRDANEKIYSIISKYLKNEK